MSGNLCADTVSVTHTPNTFTNHNLVTLVCKLRCTKIKIGPGYWCMNTLLLETDVTVQRHLQQLIEQFWEENENLVGIDFITNWDDFKARLSQVCIKLGRQSAKSKRLHKLSLEQDK